MNKAFGVDATFEHCDNRYQFTARYKDKGGFLRALSRTKHRFIDAVDFDRMQVIRKDNIEAYRKGLVV